MHTILDRMREGGTGRKLADDFVAGLTCGYSWAQRRASLQELEMLHKYFLSSRGKMTYPCESLLASMDKSILTLLVLGNGGGDLRDLSPLDPIGFIAGALEWRLQRNRLQRSRLRKKKRRETSALPVPRQNSSQQLGQAVNLRERARAAPCADAGAAITAAHAVDNASNGLTAGRREQYLHALCENNEDEWEAELDEALEEIATETPKFAGRGSRPPALQ